MDSFERYQNMSGTVDNTLQLVIDHLKSQLGIWTHAALPSDVLLDRLIKTFSSKDFHKLAEDYNDFQGK